jgi:hypothetical protein
LNYSTGAVARKRLRGKSRRSRARRIIARWFRAAFFPVSLRSAHAFFPTLARRSTLRSPAAARAPGQAFATERKIQARPQYLPTL